MVGWVKRNEPTIYKYIYIEGGFSVKTNTLIV